MHFLTEIGCAATIYILVAQYYQEHADATSKVS